MPEWTGNTRDEVYKLLSDGKLNEANAFIKTFPKFKQTDMKPVDATAMASFAQKIEADDQLQEVLCVSSQDDSESVRRFSIFLLGKVKVNGKYFAGCLDRLMGVTVDGDALVEDMVAEATGKAKKDRPQRDPVDKLATLNMYFVDAKERKLIHSLIEAICASPSPEGMALLKRPPKERNSVTGSTFNSWITDSGLRTKYEKAIETLNKAAAPSEPLKKTEKPAVKKSKAATGGGGDNSRRDELIAVLIQGDATKIQDFIKKLPKMTAAQVKDLCAELPAGATAILNTDAQKLEQALDWMQDAGPLGTVATEWVKQADWQKTRQPTMDFVSGLMAKTRSWEDSKEGVFYLRTYTKPPKLNHYFDVFAAHVDSSLIAEYSFPARNTAGEPFKLKLFALQGIAAAMVRQCGIDVAREKMNAISLDPRFPKHDFSLYHMRETMEREYYVTDEIEELFFPGYIRLLSPEEREHRYSSGIKNNELGIVLLYARDYIRDPRFSGDLIPRVCRQMSDKNPSNVDTAFRLLVLVQDLAAELGYHVAELTAQNLWHMKPVEVKKAMLRLQGLVRRGICAPAEAAGLIEQTFSSEEPATWRAAAEGIQFLRKMDPKIELTTTTKERIEEIIARDPVKNGKFLSPLLGRKL